MMRTDAEPRIHSLCEYIRARVDTGAALTLEELGKQAGLSPFHLQRKFTEIVGVSPKQFADAYRMQKLKGGLRSHDSVTTAIYDAGFGSSSRVYERIDTRLGMTPREYRAGGKDVEISYASIESPLGLLMVAATDRGLCFVQFGESHRELFNRLRTEYPAASLKPIEEPRSPEFSSWMASLTKYLQNEDMRLDLPVDVRGTAFQLKVWRYLQSIPPGVVQSYSEVAAAVGNPRGVRAVARACSANRVALVIPCHRVIRGNGELGGYRWGLALKRTLLDQERARKRSPFFCLKEPPPPPRQSSPA